MNGCVDEYMDRSREGGWRPAIRGVKVFRGGGGGQ